MFLINRKSFFKKPQSFFVIRIVKEESEKLKNAYIIAFKLLKWCDLL